MYRKSALVRVGNYRNTYPHIEDWDLWVRLSEVGKIVNLPVTTVLYRVHPNQTTEIHSFQQRESILAFSLGRLRSCLRDPMDIPQGSRGLSGLALVREVISSLFFVRPSICVSGVFGRKEVRRRFAGYLYSQSNFGSSRGLSGKVRTIFIRVLVVLIDPRLLYVKAMNQFRK